MLSAPQAKPGPRRPPAFEPLDLRLLARPLEFIAAEHYRLRAALTQLDCLARGSMGEGRRKLAQALLHLRRAGDSAFLASLDTPAAEHGADVARLTGVVAGLRGLAEARQRHDILPDFAANARAAGLARSHRP